MDVNVLTDDQLTEADVVQHVADILFVLVDVGAGDMTPRLPLLPEGHAMRALYAAVNNMIATLGEKRAAVETYRKELEERLATIDLQRAAIRELSTPIIEVWEGVLCLPVVGVIDSGRASEISTTLLEAVVARRAELAIIDVTGIEVMDTATADHFIRISKAVRLLGCRCSVTGLNPRIASTIVEMGTDLGDVTTYPDLRRALYHFVESA